MIMPQLSLEGLKNKNEWSGSGIKVPDYDLRIIAENTAAAPVWVHFGAGNIFRGFIARLQNTLLNEGLSDKGIIAAETFDYEIIDKIYRPFDNLTLMTDLYTDGNTQYEVIASITDSVKVDSDPANRAKMNDIISSPSMQMLSFTVTEKGYKITDGDGNYLPVVKRDIEAGPEDPAHVMSIVASLLYTRFKAGRLPLAIVSMDNCSQNGAKLKESVVAIADEWLRKGFVDAAFIDYINDDKTISFPWSMIDKITPRPDMSVYKNISAMGFENMGPVTTSVGTFIAPFVNAEVPEYLVIEDNFPNGRPPLEKAGVYMTDRRTVNLSERMKVTACLNPLHTCLAVFGCLLGFTKISDEMEDKDLNRLVHKLGYDEFIKVVDDPKILSPEKFIEEVLEVRLPNRFLPDTPQRIVTDTSLKMPIRFGETIKSYNESPDLSLDDLTLIPLTIAGWLRYLSGKDDNWNDMELSSDPQMGELQKALEGIKLGDISSVGSKLVPVLSRADIFGMDLSKTPLYGKIEQFYAEMIKCKGAVRELINKYTD